jgi:hypothetical protein
MLPLALAYPMSYPGPDYNCICDHYQNEAYENTIYDEYTATGLTGNYYSQSVYGSVQWWHNRGTGGVGWPPTDSPMICDSSFYDGGSTTYYYRSDSWAGPLSPFPGSPAIYYTQDWIKNHNYPIAGFASGSTSSWFNEPFYPYDAWYCGGRTITIYPS